MLLRRTVAITAFFLAPGALGWIACGGGIGSSGAVDASSESGSSSGAGSSGSGGGRSSSSSSGGGGADATTADALPETGRAFDAAVPDAFPADCGVLTLVLRPDAAPNTCAFTPADVACDASTDCIPYTVTQCGCVDGVYGLNTTNMVKCVAPPCAPPPPGSAGCQPDNSGFEAQDCRLAADLQQVAVACVDHQCMTYAVGP